MKRLIVTGLLLCGFALNANADIWKWVDANGKTHFVDTTTPIYTWIDEFGRVQICYIKHNHVVAQCIKRALAGRGPSRSRKPA